MRRRTFALSLPAVAMLSALSRTSAAHAASTSVTSTSTSGSGSNPVPGFVETWEAAPTAVPPDFVEVFQDQTVRQIVHISVGGYVLRVRFTNKFGTTPLTIGEADVALSAADGTDPDIDPATNRTLLFNGQTSVTIAAGAETWSDPVALDASAGGDLVISIYLPDSTPTTTMHASAYQYCYIASGNVAASANLTPVATTQSHYWLSGVAVSLSSTALSNVVAFGDSITDGTDSTIDTNNRWPDLLAARMRAVPSLASTGVANAGIGGNRLLYNADVPSTSPDYAEGAFFGEAGVKRFPQDVLGQPGVRAVIVLIGVNDLGQPGVAAPASQEPTADQLIAGYEELIQMAHAQGVQILGGTIMPFANDIYGFWSPSREVTREAVNNWIRTSGAYDGVVDFDAAIRDPSDPEQLNPAYNSGDGVHPNDAGMAVLADAVPLSLLEI